MWNKEELVKLKDLIQNQHKTFREAGKILSKSFKSCKNRYHRTNWEVFEKNPESYSLLPKKWTKEEAVLLQSLRKDVSLSFADIGKKLGRTPGCCEEKFKKISQKTNNFNPMQEAIERKETQKTEEKSEKVKHLVAHIVNLSRQSVDKLEEMSKAFFLEKTSMREEDLPIPFKEIKEEAKQLLQKMGLFYDAQKHLGEGTYIVVGDSHGKHTKRHVFSMLNRLNSMLGAKNIIHIGHILDDDNELSYCWQSVKNLIILAKREELQTIGKQEYKYNVVRNEIFLGNLSIGNQDEINDYTNVGIGKIKKQIFPNTTITNLHRHEMDTRTSLEGDNCQIFSPGCLCEPHITRTIKQINWEDGNLQVKLAYWDGFVKYRRMRHRYIFWEQGVLIVHVDKSGNFDVIPCRIHKTSHGYTTSYFNKIVAEDGIFNPEEKIFFNGDVHVKSHDENILSMQEQFCSNYNPDTIVNVGDISDNKPLNHHIMTRNGWAIQQSILDEYAGVHYVLSKMRKWGKDFHLIFGNHERFAKDFVEKMPQFKDLLDFSFLTNLKSLGIKLVQHKEILKLGKIKFIHGDLKMFGAKGENKIEKVSQVIGENTILGDIHYPSIRFGCYSVGMSGKMNQEYNETSATRWTHGFGFCNTFDGKCFISLVSIINNRFSINKTSFAPKNTLAWKIPPYSALIKYDF